MTVQRAKRLLALDGGGLMGLISIGYLCQIEKQLREASGEGPEFRLRDYFDYFGGTSTGAIIASALALGRSATEIREFYLKHGARMFTQASLWMQLRSGFSHKYNHDYLAGLLQQEFTDQTILDLQTSGALRPDQHLMVVLRNAQNDSTWPLSTNPDDRYNDAERPNCNRHIPLWQIIRASTAAPSFFQPERIKFPDGSAFSFVDGGLTPHNNPAWKLFQMATLPEYRLGWEKGVDRGAALHTLASRTPSDLMRGANQEIDTTCRTVGHCLYGHRIDRQMGNMVGGSSNGKQFSYIRYDADVSHEGQEDLGVPLPWVPLKMDDVSKINHFDLIGEYAARKQVDVTSQFAAFAIPQ